MNSITAKIITSLLNLASLVLAFFSGYFKGKKAKELDILKKQLEEREKRDEILLTNARESDVIILDKLRNKYKRKER